ncbi:helix-turn-helix domain-containing protein [Myceligenerans indicum]|uniref:Helix-turn-helix domain-containing protein n=1 Tax=Myceligenerans indicum TaxID=2593663 RepID=A0ABS1LKY7_9MICO|nr:helix-turn-helix domain-containing protein [Myceligenerans indicum]MBL0886891.1 helix-turn-helix domain-containing protein [Myceligenerans indicum]
MGQVDPLFGRRLRELREAAGLSLRDMYRLSRVSKSLLSEYENGRRRPSAERVELLDECLDAGGALAGMVPEPAPSAADADRIERAAASPRLVDRQTVEALAGVLASHRRLDDTMTAGELWPIAAPSHDLVVGLAHDVRGRHADALRTVAAESLQFLGWLHSQLGHYARADRLWSESATRAESVDAASLASQSRRFRGSLAWERKRPATMVQHYQHAAATPGAGRLHQIDATIRTAHGLALMGEHRDAVAVLHQAQDTITAADDTSPDEFAYWLTPTWLRFPLGLALLELGQPAEAAQNLSAGLAGLPDDQRETNWTTQYKRALADAQGAT